MKISRNYIKSRIVTISKSIQEKDKEIKKLEKLVIILRHQINFDT